MSNQPPGRRTESLFDNRYRYDYIYPRGRSGETLRAYDTHDNDRPVVIKRPAPQDAPPMRAGHEVSIRTERQALERLAGHRVLIELRGSGTFRVGGHTHEYIVMDLAGGEIVEQMVLDLAARGITLPELEILTIVDGLLDLLAYAHDRQVVYNDVDAKHLFWDRADYRLKVIDWGNAVFLDEPGALPTVSRATDIYQVGELLTFILTGGNRLAVETGEDGEHFYVNFGADSERISPRLQAIITRAVNPDPRRRFGTILELRHALNEYRQPLAKARDEIVARVRKRVRATASVEELTALRAELDAALEMDPGFPEATRLASEIQTILRQISVQADLDAIRIYLESGNWPRALSLLDDLLPNADPAHEPLIRFLIAASATLDTLEIAPPPTGFLQALDLLFSGEAQRAGQALLTAPEVRVNARQAQWLLAEQLAAHVPEVTLLRPHLFKLRRDLEDVPQGANALALITSIEQTLARTPVPGLTGLHVLYRQVAAGLVDLEHALAPLDGAVAGHVYEAALAAARRAHVAAEAIVALLEGVGGSVYGSPAQAGDDLHRAACIDPTSPHFSALHDYFDEVHQAVSALRQFRPRPDGANLAAWFADVDEFLHPYLDDLPDPALHDAARAIGAAAERWITVVNYLALGRRRPSVLLLREAAESARSVNEHIAAWFGDLANRLPDAPFVEKLSPNQVLADALVAGWSAWDRGDGLTAADCGRTAYDLAQTDGERLAANRLRRLSELLDRWLREGGLLQAESTDEIESETLAVLLSDEEHERQAFAEQMPSTALYLRAMGRGLIAQIQQSSSAGWRALYLHYVLRGALALQADDLDEAEFWRNAAQTSYDGARTHIAFQVLDRTLTGRRLVYTAQQAMNAVARPADLGAVRSALNAPLAADMLAGAGRAVELIEEALRSWSDGDFYATRGALDGALERLQSAASAADLRIDPFLTWLSGLRDAAAELQQVRLSVEQSAVTTSAEPDPALAEALAAIVQVTLDRLGPDHAHQVRQWEEMYRAVLETYTTQRPTRREKLAAFDRHFASLFITRHPAYPLFRHWKSLVEQLPPDEAEDDMIHLDDLAHEIAGASAPAYVDGEDAAAETRAPATSRRRSAARERQKSDSRVWNRVILLAALLLVAALGVAAVRFLGAEDRPEPALTSRPTSVLATLPAIAPPGTPQTGVAGQVTSAPLPTSSPVPPSLTPTAPPTTAPSATLTAELTATPTTAPTEEVTPSLTPTLFVTSTLMPSRTPAPVVEVAPASSSTRGDLLAGLAHLPAESLPGPAGALTPNDDGTWTLAATDSAGPALVELSPELLGTLFQPGVASTLRRADAILELVRYNQGAVNDGGVAFGLGATNGLGQQTIGQVQLVGTNVVSLGLNQNGRFRSSTEYPLQEPRLTLSVRRTDTTTLSFYVNDRLLGDSVFLFPQSEPVTLLLFASGGDVVVRVQSFVLDYSPRDEIP
ncbi:MAG: hypothetical protein KJ047_08250 [Anaerolineae bacterium]|nr:hypothetical protein [Anaerolineae bacterium]